MNRDTICVQGGYTPGNGEPRQIPIIQSTTFKYATSEDMGKLFDLEADGYFYSRLQNPTCDLVANPQPNLKCVESGKRLEELYAQALPLAETLILEFVAKLDTDEPLDKAYDHTFGEF